MSCFNSSLSELGNVTFLAQSKTNTYSDVSTSDDLKNYKYVLLCQEKDTVSLTSTMIPMALFRTGKAFMSNYSENTADSMYQCGAKYVNDNTVSMFTKETKAYSCTLYGIK